MPSRRRGRLGSTSGRAPSLGLGTAQPGGEVFEGIGLSPLRCGPVSEHHQRCGGKLLHPLRLGLGAPRASGAGQ